MEKKWQKYLFLLCWGAYFTSYIGRLNYSSAMSVMVEENIMTFSQAGLVSMIYFLTYGIGQICNGILGDHLKPRNMIFAGLFFSGTANLLMRTAGGFLMMVVLWGINGYAQSMIWPPMIRIFAQKYSEEMRMKCSVDIASSMAAGTLMSYFLSGCAIKLGGWRGVFVMACGLLLFFSVVWFAGYGKIERRLAYDSAKTPQEEVLDRKEGEGGEKALKADGRNGRAASLPRLVIQSGLAGILLPVMAHGILKDGMTQWVPTYIYENFNVTASFSVMITMLLPVINLSGAYMARYAIKKTKAPEVKVSSIFWNIAVVALVLLMTLGKMNVILTALFFAVITSVMMAINILYINFIPLYFDKYQKVSTISGFLNAAAYVGSAISTFAIGIMVERAGWNVTMVSWIIIGVVSLAVCIFKRRQKF